MDTPIKKKRGRKPKSSSSSMEDKKIPKKRGRRRKAETEALRKYTDKYEPDKELKFNEIPTKEEEEEEDEDKDIEVVNLGGLVITKKKGKSEDIKTYQQKLMNTKRNEENQKMVQVKKGEQKAKRNEFKIIDENTDNWPMKSDLCCWWCSHKFDTSPLFLPVKYDDKTKRFQVKGNFCSWACVKAYNLYSNQPGMFSRCTLITFLAKKLHGFSDKPIKCALARESLDIYGGKYSIKQFREYSEDSSRKVIIYNPRIIHINDSIID